MANVSSSNGLEKRPKLRFPGFDEPWNETPLSACFAKNIKKNADGSISNVICNSAKMGLIPQRDYFDKDIANSDNTNGYYIIEHDDFVYNPRKSSDAPYGPISRYAYPDAGIVSPLYLCFRAKGNVDTNFFEWYFHSSAWHRYIYMTGDSGARHDRVSIKDDDFFSMPIRFPSGIEQKKIAAFLNTIEQRITSQQLLVDNLKKYKRGVTAKLITEIEEKNPVEKLGDYVTVMRGGSPRPIDAYLTDSEEGIRWIKIGDAHPDQLYITAIKEKIKPEGAKKSRRVYPGDLILSNSMSFGRPYILKVDGCIHDGWLLIRDEEKRFDKRFLCFYLAADSTLAQYKKFAAGSCVNNLNSELVASVEIGIPPLEHQIYVANILEKIDKQVETATTMYELLNKVREALLQQLFI